MSFDKVEVRVFSGPDQVQVGSNTEPDLIVMNIGPKGDTGPNSVTSATTSDGTANLSLGDLEVVGGEIYTDGEYSSIYTQGATAHIFTLGSGAEIYTEGELAQIYTTGASAQIYTAGAGATIGTQGANATIYTQGANATISTAGSAAHIQTSHASAAVKSTNFAAVESGGASLVDGSMQPCLTWSAGGRNLTIPSGTATTFNTTSYTYGTGAAAAHRTALALTTLATTTPGTNVANFLEFPTSANLASALTDENGTGGGFVRAEGASLTTPTLVGTPVFNATTYTYGTGAAAAHRDALGVAGKQSKTTTSAVTSTNAVAADISDLTGFNLEANTTYRLTLHSIITTSSGGSFEFFFIASGTTYQGGTAQVGSGIQRSGGVVAGGYHYGTTSFSPLYATQNLTNGHTYGEYYFRTTATAGTAKMQFAQRSSAIAGTTTVAAGATAILEKIS